MKLKVPINSNDLTTANKELECDSSELNQMIGWNACLDEIEQCEVCFDEIKLQNILIYMGFTSK